MIRSVCRMGEISMRRSFLKILALSFALAGAVTLAVLYLNRTQPTLASGATLSREQAGRGARLTGWVRGEDGYTFALAVEDARDSYAVMIPFGRPDRFLWCNGEAVTGTGRASVCYVLPRPEEGQSVYVLRLEELRTHAVYAVESGYMEGCLAAQETANLALIAAMSVMAMYTMSLYCFKRSERYLLDFLIYQLLNLSWSVMLLTDITLVLPSWLLVSRGINWMVIVVTLKCCVDLTELDRPRRLGKAMQWRFIPLWAGGLYLFMGFSGGLRAIVSLALLALCEVVLAYGAARRIKGVGWLLLGMCLRLGMSTTIFIPSLSFIAFQESFLFFILRGIHFIELPFILGCMFCVNQKFAYQFSESERLTAHLDELVTERTAELKVMQQERQSMILNITHDLRTPLFVIKNCLDIVEEDPASLGDMLPILKQRSAFVTGLTEDLFLLVKLQEGKLMLNQQRESLSGLLEELYAWLAVEADERGIKAAGRIEPELYVWGDRLRLQQLFQNLIANALHYTPPGGTVELRARAEEGPGEERRAAVFVRDSGKGIRREDAEHVFERYFYTKADNKHDSSGLGLSIARELALAHRGDISFSSEEGHGTEFVVTLLLC